jgi:hypothetical protein
MFLNWVFLMWCKEIELNHFIASSRILSAGRPIPEQSPSALQRSR